MNVEIFHGGDKINMPNEDHRILVTLTKEDDDDFVEMYSMTRKEFVAIVKDYVNKRRAKHQSQSEKGNISQK